MSSLRTEKSERRDPRLRLRLSERGTYILYAQTQLIFGSEGHRCRDVLCRRRVDHICCHPADGARRTKNSRRSAAITKEIRNRATERPIFLPNWEHAACREAQTIFEVLLLRC
jgi:hypothetical protein